jgi:type I restriction enzyme S subunit
VSFATAPIGMLFSVANGATPKSGEEHLWDGDIPWVTPADLGKNGTVGITSGSRSITREGLDSCGTQIVPTGTIVLSIRAPIGHTAIATVPLCFNQGCRGLIPSKKVLTKFGYWSIIAAKPTLQSEGQGTTFQELGRDKLRSVRIALPDLPTQRAIADFLDRETARIDLLIEKKQRLLDMVSPRFEALIHAARSEGTWRRFGFCVKSTTRPIPNTSDQSFVPLGLYNRGRGFFKKSDTDFDELGDSSFFFVEEGDLVFSGQFAWEGAVGLVSERESGCVVSHRYPVYVGTEGVISEYLYAYFRSHHGRFLMDNCSRGAAGRNRPLNTRILEKEKIPVPPLSIQDEVKHIVLFERRLKGKITPSIDRLREYRSALITAAVTGQISVSEWNKSGEVDRQLDSLADKVSA